MAKNLQFKVSSSLKNIIGRELITDDFIAVFELVKNAFDAYAKNVKIIFDGDKIIVIDDGKGMNYDDLINKWLFVAYSAKREGEEDKDFYGDLYVRIIGLAEEIGPRNFYNWTRKIVTHKPREAFSIINENREIVRKIPKKERGGPKGQLINWFANKLKTKKIYDFDTIQKTIDNVQTAISDRDQRIDEHENITDQIEGIYPYDDKYGCGVFLYYKFSEKA